MKLLVVLVTVVLLGFSQCQSDFCDYDKTQTQMENQFDSCSAKDFQYKHPDEVQYPGNVCFRSVPSEVTQSIKNVYPEGKKVVDQLISKTVSFVPTADGTAHITFYATGAGYHNKLSLYSIENGEVSIKPVVFPYINSKNSASYACLKVGDTSKVSVKGGVRYGFVLHPDYWSTQKTNLYSDVTMANGLLASDGKGKVSWFRFSQDNVDGDVIFGFEDMVGSGSDDDYNDVMFTLNIDVDTDFGDIPIYDGGFEECIPLDTVTSSSYAEKDCYSWGLLEKVEENACNFFLEPPPGWAIAEYNEENIEVVKSISKWHKHECLGLVLPGPGGKLQGVDKDGNDCDVLEKSGSIGGDKCRSVDCAYRVVIRRKDPHESCGNEYDFCDIDRKLPYYPVKDEGWVAYPNAINSFILNQNTGTANDQIKVRNVVESDKKNVDVVIAVDLENISSDDVKNIKTNYKKICDQLKDSYNYRLAIAAYSQGNIVNSMFRTTCSGDSVDQDLNIIVTKAGSDSMSVDFIKKASECSSCDWRQDLAFRVVVLVTKKNALPSSSVSDSDVNSILNNNNVLVFVGDGTSDKESDWQALANKFKNSVGKRYAAGGKSNNKQYFYSFHNGIKSSVDTVIGKSYLHVVKGSNIVSISNALVTSIPGAHSITVGPMNGDFPSSSEPAIVLNSLGRSQTNVYVHTNNPPVASDIRVTIPVGSTSNRFKLQANDPDGGKVIYSLNDFGAPGQFESVVFKNNSGIIGEDDLFLGDELEVEVGNNDIRETFTLKYTVDDGCAQAEANIIVESSCTDVSTPELRKVCVVPVCPSGQQVVELSKREVSREIFLSGIFTDGQVGEVGSIVRGISKPDGDFFFKTNSGTTLSDPLSVGDIVESVFYRSVDLFGSPLHTLTYDVYNKEFEDELDTIKHSTCTILINVVPSNDPPVFNGDSEFEIDEDQRWLFRIDESKVEYEVKNVQIPNRLIVRIAQSYLDENVCVDEYMCLKCCVGDVCSTSNCEQTFENGLPTFTFTPYPDDSGQNYHTVPFLFSDKYQTPESRKETTINYLLHVNPVNDAPDLIVDSGIKVLGSETDGGANEIEKGEEFVFSWNVYDIDNLPSTLSTIVTATPLTRSPWDAFSCVNNEDQCSNQVELKPSSTIKPTVTVETKCEFSYPSDRQNEKCYARFTLRFVPQNSQVPYIQFTLQGTDHQSFNGLSQARQILLNVIPKNLPPVVWSPPKIESTSSLVNIRVGNSTANVTDDAPPLWPVTLTMTVVSENGHFVLPEFAVSKCDVSEDNLVIVCTDTVPSINNWIQELRFNITNGDRTANVSFIVNDNGFPGLSNSEMESELVVTEIVIDDSIVPIVPKSSSKLLIIALSVGAAGAIAVGVLVALLRNKLSPPTDDYFQIGTDTVSTSPQSPLYQGQTKEGFSGLYSGAKA